MQQAAKDFILAIALVVGVTIIGAIGGTFASSFKHESVNTCGGSSVENAEGVPLKMRDCR